MDSQTHSTATLPYPPLLRKIWISTAITVSALQGGGVLAASPPSLILSRPEDQARFRVTTFAQNLSFPTSLTQLSDGSLLVGTSDGNSPFSSTSGSLLRLTDFNADGIADGAPVPLATGLPGLVTSVRRAGNLVMALSSQSGNEAITFWRTGSDPSQPFSPAGSIRFSFPSPFLHTTYALGVRPSPVQPQNLEVFFNIGSEQNAVSTPSSLTVTAIGAGGLNLAPAQLEADSIHRIVLSDSGSQLTSSVPQLIARGLRNAAGMILNAAGDLLLQDNGFDNPANLSQSLSADELNRIKAADLGTIIPDFGFAETYIDYATGSPVGPTVGVTMPEIAFLPLQSERSEGAVELAMAPPAFGPGFVGGVFLPFFGDFNSGGVNNEENPLVFADPQTGDYFHFVGNQLLGHPNGILATVDSIFLTDLSYTGSLFAPVGGVPPNQAGVIYQITPYNTPVPTPGPLPLLGMTAAFGWSRRLKQRMRRR